MGASWKKMEDYTRDLASVMWGRPVSPERIDGVNFDAVVRVSDDEIVLIEITEEFSLEKVRGDVAKIQAVKVKYALEGVFAKAYIVLPKEPTPGMLDIARPAKINVVSLEGFSREAFDYSSYANMRRKVEFGSSIDPLTGKSDSAEYIAVEYTDESERKSFNIQAIAERLRRGEKIILLGDYGTGKSRCTREVFNYLVEGFSYSDNFVFAINLREHWGAVSAIEIIAGHLKRLGLSGSVDRAMQLLVSGKIVLILDGFDEVGSQTFGGTQDRRESIRKYALQGIRELITSSSAGVLVTGRPHYFNSNKEMFESLGVSSRPGSFELMKCHSEFSVDQARKYLANIGLVSDVPKWLPRKPLMFLILAQIERDEAEKILSNSSGEIGFWGQFIDTVCIREAGFHKSIDPLSVRDVLTNLVRITRRGDRELGRLTPSDINAAYEQATGMAPDEAGQLMLSRLCTLGRIEPESPDRQFVDPYIVQLLFAEILANDISERNFEILTEKWRQPLKEIGLFFLAQWIDMYSLERDALAVIHRAASSMNGQVVGELISSLLLIEGEELDFSGLHVEDADVALLSLGVRRARNIFWNDCIFGVVAFDGCLVNNDSHFSILRPYIAMATGLTSIDALPEWVIDFTVENTQSASNSSRIKSSNLPPSQKLFLSIIQKIFFQRGGGRRESSLFKGGFGQQYDRGLIEKILNILVNDGFVEKSKDVSGFIYNPRREYTAKMRLIKDQLGLSKDPLWEKVSKL
ncbi:hypothetical protein DDK19_28275 [Pseudomonas aeruginosa]|uniref:NACHT domain-containing protein n=1 Tax=Pseudomonas aeruginosa TaxID=287 RepID=UPI000D3E6D21|nr:NACHT domain-containing protein [Pseudomonas aeruginosa]PUV65287.1 hypothetical protein DDK19_28275 [Pseudomonas aeruginosa]